MFLSLVNCAILGRGSSWDQYTGVSGDSGRCHGKAMNKWNVELLWENLTVNLQPPPGEQHDLGLGRQREHGFQGWKDFLPLTWNYEIYPCFTRFTHFHYPCTCMYLSLGIWGILDIGTSPFHGKAKPVTYVLYMFRLGLKYLMLWCRVPTSKIRSAIPPPW